jgi:hypothetical protein
MSVATQIPSRSRRGAIVGSPCNGSSLSKLASARPRMDEPRPHWPPRWQTAPTAPSAPLARPRDSARGLAPGGTPGLTITSVRLSRFAAYRRAGPTRRRGSHSGNHADELPLGAADSHEQRPGTRPRSRTDLNRSGCLYGHLRIRRSCRRVPDEMVGLGASRSLPDNPQPSRPGLTHVDMIVKRPDKESDRGHHSRDAYAGCMSEPAVELPADDAPLARAAEDARRGVATHLTIHGERVAVIMPEGVIEVLREVAALLTNERIASYLPALLPRAMSWTSSLPEADLPVFISELAAAAASGRDAPEKVAAVLREWRATAEIYADPREAARLRQALQEAREGKATPWEYDDVESS